MHVSLQSDVCDFCTLTSQRPVDVDVDVDVFSGGFGRCTDSRVSASSEGPLSHGGSQHCKVSVNINTDLECDSLRHNHLGDSHIIGRLLKPHMTMTIFMNFAARHSLIKPKDSLTQQQFSVNSAIIHPLYGFHILYLSIKKRCQFNRLGNFLHVRLTKHIHAHRWEDMEL